MAIIAAVKILPKARLFGLVRPPALDPLVGLVMILVFAFSDWPVDKELRQLPPRWLRSAGRAAIPSRRGQVSRLPVTARRFPVPAGRVAASSANCPAPVAAVALRRRGRLDHRERGRVVRPSRGIRPCRRGRVALCRQRLVADISRLMIAEPATTGIDLVTRGPQVASPRAGVRLTRELGSTAITILCGLRSLHRGRWSAPDRGVRHAPARRWSGHARPGSRDGGERERSSSSSTWRFSSPRLWAPSRSFRRPVTQAGSCSWRSSRS